MKNSIIIKSLVLISVSLFSCSKTDTKPSGATQKISLSDSLTAKPNTLHSNQNAIAENIAHYIANEYLTPADLKTIGMRERKFCYQQIDLNGDGKKEIFVGFSTPYFCGTGGCAMILLDDHLNPITKFTVTRPPVYADPTTENGWKILYIQDGNQWKTLHYKNGKYPSNPSVLPNTSEKPSDLAIIILPENKTKYYPF